VFAPRCPVAVADTCRVAPPPATTGAGMARCWFPGSARETVPPVADRAALTDTPPLRTAGDGHGILCHIPVETLQSTGSPPHA